MRGMKTSLSLICLVSISQLVLAAEPAEDEIALEVKPVRGVDSAVVEVDNLTATLTIESKRGIGQAVVVRKSGAWPVKLAICLGIYPLEGFTASSGNKHLEASLGFHQKVFRDDVPVRERSDDAKGDGVVDHVPVSITPQGDDAIVIELPTDWLEADETELLLQWVDAYR